MGNPKPLHQRAVTLVVIVIGVLVATGTFFDALSNTINWVSEPVTYVGTVVLLIGIAAVLAWLRYVGVSWVVGGERTTLRGLGRNGTLYVLALVGVLWVPRLVERLSPPDRTAIPWAALLWDGQEMVVDLGELPDHMGSGRGSLPHGGTYTVQFQRVECVWRTTGPRQFSRDEAGAPRWTGPSPRMTLPNYVDEASPAFRGRVTPAGSQTGTSECNSPDVQRMVVMGVPVEFDRRGVISFGGREHTIGALRVPFRWDWPSTWGNARYTGQEQARN